MIEGQGQTVHKTVKQTALEAMFMHPHRDPTCNLFQV